MTWIDGLLIFITILLIYFSFILFLKKRNLLEKYNLGLMGPVLLIKTKKGIGYLKRVSSKKRFWRGYGTVAVIICFILMIVMVFFFIWQINLLTAIPAEQRSNLPGPEFALVLPGINPILPLEYLVYIVVALSVAIIVHEFSHGILTFVADIKVKSMGIAYMIIPIGAFVEPDEEALMKTKIPKRLRVFAVGPMANFIVVLICLLLFTNVFMASVQPGDGLTVYEVYEDSPAYNIGIRKGTIILSVNKTDFTNISDPYEKYFEYNEIINKTKVNDSITISFIKNNEKYLKQLKLDNKINYVQITNETNLTNIKGKGETGIFSFVDEGENLKRLSSIPTNTNDILNLISLPVLGYFSGYNPIISPFTDSYEITGPLSFIPEPVFWIIVNLLYWIFWLNLMVGLFNVIPMKPLDGGYLFTDYIRLFIKRVRKEITEERLDKIVGNISLVVSLIILFLIVFPFFFKYL